MNSVQTSKLRIGIDASSVVGRRTGIGHATAQLLSALAECWPQEWAAAQILVNSRHHDPPATDAWLQSTRLKLIRRRLPGRVLLRSWQHLKWPPVERLVGAVDLFHAPASYIPPVRAARRIVTVHDLYFKYAPDQVEPYGGQYFAQTFPAGLAKMDHLIAVSQFTRDEILKFYPLPPDRISVVPWGVDRQIFNPEPQARDVSYLDLLGIKKPYVLCVATIEPRKNLVALIEAYARVRQVLRAADQRLPPLVITGLLGWGIKDLETRLKQAGMQDAVKLTGYLPGDALPALYRQALGFVFPSLYEGFGMPVLEAMACGCPTALARAGALPEVGGDATTYFDPRDTGSMANALLDFVTNPPMRADLREAGLRRAAQFTWAATARATLDVYRHTMGIAEANTPIPAPRDVPEQLTA